MSRFLATVLLVGAGLLAGSGGHAAAQTATTSAACDPLRDSLPRRGSPVAELHPSRVATRYAEAIAAGDWLAAFGRLENDVDAALGRLDAGGTAPFRRIGARLRSAIGTTDSLLVPIVALPLAERAAALVPLEIGQYVPKPDPVTGERFILQTDASPRVEVPRDSLHLNEYEAICWSSRSMGRLLNAFNYVTIPRALARIQSLNGEWERYRDEGPVQLPHELLANSLLRRLVASHGEARYHPARVDLVIVHPFLGYELARRDGSLERHESYAVETAGFTVWDRAWRRHYGASWVVAWDPDGRVAHGPLIRASGYFTWGVLFRRDTAGTRRRTLLVTFDLLRFLHLDAAPLDAQRAQAIAGQLMNRAPSP